jgi:phage/plasmid-like protein (TIGR03299 family)
MAHLVETMAYAGATPWHGLGVPVGTDLTPLEIAMAAGIDWPVEKQMLFAVNGAGTVIDVPGNFALVRVTDGKVLDVVGSRYTPTQNLDAIAFFRRFTEEGSMAMETAGSLEGGRRIWALAKIGDGYTLAGGDRVEGYLLLCSPHIMGEAFTVKLTLVRVVCHNTMNRALRAGGPAYRMSHLYEFDAARQDAACVALGLATKELRAIEAQSKVLAAAPAEYQQVVEYVAQLSGSSILETAIAEADACNGGSVLDSVIAAHAGAELVRGIKEANLNSVGKTILDSILSSPGSDLESANGTWWGALSGVTHAADYKLGRTDDSRLTSAWFGPRAQLKSSALNLAVEYASGNIN